MIVVYTVDGQRTEFPSVDRFKTDEHNNLEIHSGAVIVGCFSEGTQWRLLVEDGE